MISPESALIGLVFGGVCALVLYAAVCRKITKRWPWPLPNRKD